MKSYITSYCSITPESCSLNGKVKYQNLNNRTFNDFSKSIYKQEKIAYPKFSKMDGLSKLAFIASEVLLSSKDTSRWNEQQTAIVLGNKSSSIVSDQKHYDSYKDRASYFPSPAVFVYTLPNIMLGEISIKNKITGETSCFIQDQFDSTFLYQYIKDLFDSEGYHRCITGWVDYTPFDYEAHLFLVSKSDIEEVKTIFDHNFKRLII